MHAVPALRELSPPGLDGREDMLGWIYVRGGRLDSRTHPPTHLIPAFCCASSVPLSPRQRAQKEPGEDAHFFGVAASIRAVNLSGSSL